MNYFKSTVVTCFVIYFIVIVSAFVMNDTEKMANVGLAILLLSLLFFLVGLILLIPKSIREVGKALLICAGVAFLIGLGICSFFQIRL